MIRISDNGYSIKRKVTSKKNLLCPAVDSGVFDWMGKQENSFLRMTDAVGFWLTDHRMKATEENCDQDKRNRHWKRGWKWQTIILKNMR